MQTVEVPPFTDYMLDSSLLRLLVRERVYAIGIHGLLPPSCGALVYKANDPDVSKSPRIWNTATNYGQSATNGEWLLYPGDVMPMAEPLEGCRVVFGDNVNGNWDNTQSGGANLTKPRAIVRVWTKPLAQYPQSIGFQPIAGIYGAGPAAAAPQYVDEGAWIGWNTRRVILHWRDNSATRQRIQGAESGEFEVWWLSAAGLWMHNPADDCKASTPRGAISATHDAEQYEVGGGVVSVYVRKTSGDDFFVDALMTEV